MLVLIVVEVVERGEISPAVAQQGGWGVGAGHWARVSWGIRVRIRIRDTSRNKDIFRSVVNKPIPLGRPPLQDYLLHFSFYIYIFLFPSNTPSRTVHLQNVRPGKRKSQGKAHRFPPSRCHRRRCRGIHHFPPRKCQDPTSIRCSRRRQGGLLYFLFPHPLTGYSNGLASHPVPSPQIDDPAKRCTRFVRWLYSGGDWQCRQGRCAVYYL